jgi:alpha-L-rhamnosidase
MSGPSRERVRRGPAPWPTSAWPTLLPALFSLLLAIGIAEPCAAQRREPRIFNDAPVARWIAPPDVPGDVFGVFHFRRTFELSSRPETFVAHVSADNRYRLFVNGILVSSGPQRSDLTHWRYETVDLAPHLRAGRNVLAALVWNWGPERPDTQFSRRTAFLLQGDGEREAALNSGPQWKVLHDAGYAPLPVDASVSPYFASPPGESVDGSRYPWGWEQVDYPDESWSAPDPGARFQRRGANPFGQGGGWQLVPRSIPPLEETPIRFARVRRAEGIEPSDGFLRGTGDLVVPAGTRAVLLLDQDHLTNAFAVLETSGGAGSEVALVYAEALKDAQGNKGNRDEIEGRTMVGVRDEFRLDGGERRRFQTLWFRTWRYVQLEIETGEELLRIHDLHGTFTGYPFELRARFTSDLPWLTEMWEMNWRTARLGAGETYYDNAYYEQHQYLGDARIQALITLYMSDDDRLVRQAIEHFHYSRIPEGLTASRYPSDQREYIPPYSLIWVAMVHDYWMHRDDPGYVRGFLPGVRGVLAWFEDRVDDSGMLGPIPWWPCVDFGSKWPAGVPPGGREGHSTVITLQYVYALSRAAEMEDRLGAPGQAARYRELARSLRATVRVQAWDAERGLFRDTPEGESFSQQANVLAVLTDALPQAEQTGLMERVLADATLTQSSYHFRFYQLEALAKAGLGGRYVEQLGPWRGMLALGLTTTSESPEPTRTDSQGWNAHPNYGLLATVLGVRPAEPGFRSVRIAPHLGPLQRAEGRVPHPLGEIDVRLERTDGEGLNAEVVLPAGLEGVLEWGGRETALRPGRQDLRF